jgi:hypothetical protein
MACPATRKLGSEWRMANGEWQIGMRVERTTYYLLQGPAYLAGWNGFSRDLLSARAKIAARGIVRNVFADQTRGVVNPREYRGGTWPRKHSDIRPIPSNRPRLIQGTGDASAIGGAGSFVDPGTDRRADGSVRYARKANPLAHSSSATEGFEAMTSPSISTRHSPLAIRHV